MLNIRSIANLHGVHPDLVAVLKLASDKLSAIDPLLTFVVTEGLRTITRQRQLVAAGASRTLKSRHIAKEGEYGHAADIAPVLNGELRWDWPLFNRIIPVIKLAASELSVGIECGADWKSFPDGPHIQLPIDKYP